MCILLSLSRPALLIRGIPYYVAGRALAVHQIDRIVRDDSPATYIGYGLPDHLGVITGHRAPLVKRTDLSAVIILLFVDPALE